MHETAKPVGGKLLTPGFNILLGLGAVAVALLMWRFVMGLGATTALSSGYPWGLWIAFDVVTGTALACGGYAMALLVYVFNRGQYHPLVRPAILTSALGYTLAAIAVGIDVGRPWQLWKVPMMIWRWNGRSVLLEVAVCIMTYVLVLWLELAPAILERWAIDGRDKLKAFAEKSLPFLNKSLFTIIAIGIILPTLHQSSLGSLMLLGGPKLHPLWNTRLLPLFFLLTCIAMGYAMVVFEAAFSQAAFGHRADRRMLRSLQSLAASLGVIFAGVRLLHLVVRGRAEELLRFDLYSLIFWIEIVLFVIPFVMVQLHKGEANLSGTFLQALILVFAGGLYRFDTFLLAFDPGPGFHYFPSVAETLITVGLVALELAAYVAIVKTFPILSGTTIPSRTAAAIQSFSPSAAR